VVWCVLNAVWLWFFVCLLFCFVLLLMDGLWRAQLLSSVESTQEAVVNRIQEVGEMFSSTQASASEYHAQLLLCKERHLKLPQVEHVQMWLDTQSEVFTSGEYGETADQVTDRLASFEGYRSMLELQRAVLDGMSSEQEAILTRIEEVKAHMASVDEVAEEYNTQLLLVQERLQKLPTISMVKQWLDNQMAVFTSGECVVSACCSWLLCEP